MNNCSTPSKQTNMFSKGFTIEISDSTQEESSGLVELVKQRDELLLKLNDLNIQIRDKCGHKKFTESLIVLNNGSDMLYDYECNACHYKWGDSYD